MSLKSPIGFVKFVSYWKVKPKIRNAWYAKANGVLWKEKPKQIETQESVEIYVSSKSQPQLARGGN